MTLTGTGRDLLDDELLADFDGRAPVYDRHNAARPVPLAPGLQCRCNRGGHDQAMPETEEEKIVTERLARCLESGDFAPFARAYAPDALLMLTYRAGASSSKAPRRSRGSCGVGGRCRAGSLPGR